MIPRRLEDKTDLPGEKSRGSAAPACAFLAVIVALQHMLIRYDDIDN